MPVSVRPGCSAYFKSTPSDPSGSVVLTSGLPGSPGCVVTSADDVRHDFEPLGRRDRAAGPSARRTTTRIRWRSWTGAARSSVSFRRPILRTIARPNVDVSRGSIAKLRKRNPELGAPAALAARHRDVPHRIPALIVVRVVEPVAVLLDACRIDGELERRSPIVKRIDEHADPVRRRVLIAPRADADNALRIGVEGLDRDVERGRVVGDSRFGRKGRRRALRAARAAGNPLIGGTVCQIASLSSPSTLMAVASGIGVAAMRPRPRRRLDHGRRRQRHDGQNNGCSHLSILISVLLGSAV